MPGQPEPRTWHDCLKAARFAGATIFFSASTLWAANPAPPAGDAQRRAGEQFFETKVRPILAEHCFKCHGPERHKANLRLDSLHAMLAGGDSGPALIAGDAEHSLLVQAISYSDDYVQMPPSKKLPDALIADLTRWVKTARHGRARNTANRPHPGVRSKSRTGIGPTGSFSRFAAPPRRRLPTRPGPPARSTCLSCRRWSRNSSRPIQPPAGES